MTYYCAGGNNSRYLRAMRERLQNFLYLKQGLVSFYL